MELFKNTIRTAFFSSLVVLLLSGCSAEKSDSPKMTLWNGKDFTGWELVIPGGEADGSEVWSVKNGVIHCVGVPNGYLKSKDRYSDYILTLDWRWVEKEGNSGVLLHAQEPDQIWPQCIEAQLKANSAGDFVLIQGGSITVNDKQFENEKTFMGIPKMHESNEKPLGEWNSYKIVCQGDEISLFVNGLLQNKGTAASLSEGKIGLQSEGAPIEFRNIQIESIDPD